MDGRQIATRLVLAKLGLPEVRLDTFAERLVVQKSIYLAQAAGVNMGYSFRWYLRGPYLPELTSDVFSIASELKSGFDESAGWALDEAALSALGRVQGLMPGGDLPARARQLELLASVHFLVNQRQVAHAEASEVQEVLRRYGKDYTSEEVAGALRTLRQHGLLAA